MSIFGAFVLAVLLLSAVIPFVQVFALSRAVRLGFEPDIPGKQAALPDAGIEMAAQELQQLGFARLGVMWEQQPPGSRVRSLALAWPEQRAFASITRIGIKTLAFFYTPFANGQVLLTANGYFGDIRDPGCVVQVLKNVSLADLWQVHLDRLEDFRARGCIPIDDYSRPARLEAARRFYAHPAVIRWMTLYQLRSTFLTCVGILFLLGLVGGGILRAFERNYSRPFQVRTPEPIRADFRIDWSGLHHCGDTTSETWASFLVQNTGGYNFRQVEVLIQDEERQLVLYGEAPGIGSLLPGFHTSAEQCGRGELETLEPGGTAYIARRLDMRGCTPSCSAMVRIKICADPTAHANCAVHETRLVVSQDE